MRLLQGFAQPSMSFSPLATQTLDARFATVQEQPLHSSLPQLLPGPRESDVSQNDPWSQLFRCWAPNFSANAASQLTAWLPDLH